MAKVKRTSSNHIGTSHMNHKVLGWSMCLLTWKTIHISSVRNKHWSKL